MAKNLLRKAGILAVGIVSSILANCSTLPPQNYRTESREAGISLAIAAGINSGEGKVIRHDRGYAVRFEKRVFDSLRHKYPEVYSSVYKSADADGNYLISNQEAMNLLLKTYKSAGTLPQ